MNYKREWINHRNATGFAAECARLSLSFYGGDHKPDLVPAIELAERCTAGEEISDAVIRTVLHATDVTARAADAADADGSAGSGSVYAVAAARAAARVAASGRPSSFITRGASVSCYLAGRAGVDKHEIQAAFARWVVRDLSGGRELPTELRQAAGAVVVAGDEALARELVGS